MPYGHIPRCEEPFTIFGIKIPKTGSIKTCCENLRNFISQLGNPLQEYETKYKVDNMVSCKIFHSTVIHCTNHGPALKNPL